MIKTLEELSEFLHRWYEEPQGALSLDTIEKAYEYAPPLVKAWSLFGGLLRDAEKWFKEGTPTPLCCQDGLAPPALTVRYESMLHFGFENQGNWSFGYQHSSKSADPSVLSDWTYTMLNHDPGFVQVGAKLSDFLITLCLSETIYFAWHQALSIEQENPDIDSLFGEKLWEGKYYNAVGIGENLELPSHIIHSNADQTELVLYTRTSKGKIASKPFAAKRSVAREQYQNSTKIR